MNKAIAIATGAANAQAHEEEGVNPDLPSSGGPVSPSEALRRLAVHVESRRGFSVGGGGAAGAAAQSPPGPPVDLKKQGFFGRILGRLKGGGGLGGGGKYKPQRLGSAHNIAEEYLSRIRERHEKATHHVGLPSGDTHGEGSSLHSVARPVGTFIPKRGGALPPLATAPTSAKKPKPFLRHF